MRKSCPEAVNQLPKSLLTTAKQMPDWLDDHAEQINSKDWETQLPGSHFWWIGLIKFFKFLTRYLSALLLPVLNRCLQKYFPKFLLFAFHEWKMKILAIFSILDAAEFFENFLKLDFCLSQKIDGFQFYLETFQLRFLKTASSLNGLRLRVDWSFLWFSF